MKWPPTNFKESLVSIMFVNRLVGLRSFDCFTGKLKRTISLIYVVLMATLVVEEMRTELQFVEQLDMLPLEILVYKVLTELNVMVIFYSVIAGWCSTKSFDKFVDRMMKIDDTLKLLNVPTDHRQTSFDCYKSLFHAAVFLLLILGTSLRWMTILYKGYKLLFMTVIFSFTFIATEIMTLDFDICVRAVKRRLRSVNDLLISLFATADNSRNPNKDNSTHMIEKLNAWFVLTVKPRVNEEELRRAIHTIKQVHLELVRVSMLLCHAFRIQMTLEMGLATVYLTTIVYYLYVRCTMSNEYNFAWTDMLSSVFWCIAYVIRIIQVNSSCEQTIMEANRTSTAIHALHGMQIEGELKDEIHQFALQMMLRPLKFSMFGFSLSYAFVRSCFGAVTTYSLIMVQMSNDLAAALNYEKHARNTIIPSGDS